MLKKTLLATTALVLCASLASADAPKNRLSPANMLNHAAIVHPNAKASQPVHNVAPNLDNAIFSNYSKDANAQYISWYGGRASNYSGCYSSSHGYHSCHHSIIENALAFTPVATVMTKKVTVPVFAFFPSAQFQVDIYSSVGGLPGKVIAHSHKFTASDNSRCCTQSRTATIKANLIGGTQYFIGVVGVGSISNGGWFVENTDFSGAAVDYTLDRETGTYGTTANQHHFFSSGSWHASSLLPANGAVVLK